MNPALQGVGLDPSCESTSDGNLTLIRDIFKPGYFDKKNIRLVLLRHVLEHIDEPVEFLSALRGAIGRTPLFVEEPEFAWTLGHRAFWDFCYERCNYFTFETLRFSLVRASFDVLEQRRSFGNQYQWSICQSLDGDQRPMWDGTHDVLRALAYSKTEASWFHEAETFARRKNGITLWGMSTKGVVLSNLLNRELLRGGVDVNVAKQGRYAPVSGLEIHAPKWLRDRDPGSTLLVMNPIYRNEIASILETDGIKMELICW